MTESDLDSLYGDFCRSLSEAGEARAPLLLARFALLAIGAIDDPDRVRALLASARDCEAATALADPSAPAATAPPGGSGAHLTRNPPAGWPRISNSIFYEDPAQAIDWLVRAFGFQVRLKIEGDGGRIEHSELTYGEGVVMVGGGGKASSHPGGVQQSPKGLGGANTQHMCVYVDDVDAHCANAQAAGGKITRPLKTTDYGVEYWADRSYEVEDLEGHRWYFMQRMRNPGT